MTKQNTGTLHRLTERSKRGGCFYPFPPPAQHFGETVETRMREAERANALPDIENEADRIWRDNRATAYLQSLERREYDKPPKFVDWLLAMGWGALFAVMCSAFYWHMMEYVAPCGAC